MKILKQIPFNWSVNPGKLEFALVCDKGEITPGFWRVCERSFLRAAVSALSYEVLLEFPFPLPAINTEFWFIIVIFKFDELDAVDNVRGELLWLVEVFRGDADELDPLPFYIKMTMKKGWKLYSNIIFVTIFF